MKNIPRKRRGQGYVSNLNIVDLENFATASRRYTGDIHNSTVVGLFMTPTGQQKGLDRVRARFKCVEALGRIIIRGPYPPSNAVIYMHLQL